MKKFLVLALGIVVILTTDVRAAEVHVNLGESIQAAIDGADTGDVIIVHEGTYVENINFLGKAISVKSTNPDDPDVVANTIIDGNSIDSVVKFSNGEDSTSILNGFTIQNGYSSSTGGGIYCHKSSPCIENCIIKGNTAYDGGGIWCYYSSSPSIINCTIMDNSATWGGGIILSHSSPNIANCTIKGNSATYSGGIICGGGSSPSIENCIISGNSAHYYGGGISCYSSPSITNCTITGNSVSSSGGGIYCCYNYSPSVTNCIFWNDSPDEIYACDSPLDITYSNIKGGYMGVGNIDSDPMFVDSTNGDYHLLPDSPCIDTSNPDSTITEDKDGVSRPQDGDNDGVAISDMGAYEYIPSPCEGDFDGDGDVDGSDLAIFAADFGRTNCLVQGISETITDLKTEIAILKAKLKAKNKEIEELQEHIEAIEVE